MSEMRDVYVEMRVRVCAHARVYAWRRKCTNAAASVGRTNRARLVLRACSRSLAWLSIFPHPISRVKRRIVLCRRLHVGTVVRVTRFRNRYDIWSQRMHCPPNCSWVHSTPWNTHPPMLRCAVNWSCLVVPTTSCWIAAEKWDFLSQARSAISPLVPFIGGYLNACMCVCTCCEHV
jgi:hypothetical protein